MKQNRIIIIGASAGGISAAKEIRKSDTETEVVIISNETSYPYYRPYLTENIVPGQLV